MIYIASALIYVVLVLGIGTYQYFADPHPGWDTSYGWILFFGLVYWFLISFFLKSFKKAILVYFLGILLFFIVGGFGLIAYRIDGCPMPRSEILLESNKNAWDEQSLGELRNRINNPCTFISATEPENYNSFIASVVSDPRVILMLPSLLIGVVIVLLGSFTGRTILK